MVENYTPSYDIILKKYPKLYKHIGRIDCGIGWYDLIDELSSRLEQHIIDYEKILKVESDISIMDIKQRYGMLCLTLFCGTIEMYNLINKYQDRSGTICESCSCPSSIEYVDGVCMSLCPQCLKKISQGLKNV